MKHTTVVRIMGDTVERSSRPARWVMMRFLTSVIANQTGIASAGEMKAIDEFNAQHHDAGHWVLAGGHGAPESVHHR